MLSIDTCKKILNQNGKKYTNEEVARIREFLYIFSELLINNQNSINYETQGQKSDSL